MTNKTLALWITITGVASLILAFSSIDETLLGIGVIAFYVFALIGASRLNK